MFPCFQYDPNSFWNFSRNVDDMVFLIQSVINSYTEEFGLYYFANTVSINT